MEIVLTIPDEVAPILQNGGRNGGAKPLSRRALELLALDGYKSGELTEHQLQVVLGFEDRFEVDAFLKKNGCYYDYSIQELERDSTALEELLRRNSR